jgi:hypothetical protein
MCLITTPAEDADGDGGYEHEWAADDAVSVMCAVSSPSQAAASGLPILDIGSDERQMVFSLPVTTTVRQGDLIAWHSRTFEVTSLQEPGTYDMQITAIGLERT